MNKSCYNRRYHGPPVSIADWKVRPCGMCVTDTGFQMWEPVPPVKITMSTSTQTKETGDGN